MLHKKERCLTVVDASEQGFSLPHLVAIDSLGQRFAARLHERCTDLFCYSLAFRIWHGKHQSAAAKVRQSGNTGRVGGRNHDGQIVGREGDHRGDESTLLNQIVAGRLLSEIDVGLIVQVMLLEVMMPPASICLSSRPGGSVS